MSKDELIQAVQDFFGDTSRSAQQTKDGLEEIASLAQLYADSIEGDV